MFQAVIFDFDGVILNSEPLHYQACNYVFSKLGFTTSYDEYVERYLGFADKEMFPMLLKDKGFQCSLEEINNLMEEKTEKYQEIIRQEDNLPMIDAFDQYLFFIAQETTKIAICSGSTRNEIMVVLQKLKQGKLQTYFETIVTSEDVKLGKPSAEGYLLTAERLNVMPEHCLVIEDTPHGVEAGKAAGMYVIALLTSYPKQKLKIADRIISNFKELML